MKTAIIGAGKMGRWFTRFFQEEGDSVIVSNRSKEKLLRIQDEFGVEIADNNINALKNADRVLICVPIENFEDVVREIHSHVRHDQVILDICSIKEEPVRILHEYIKIGITLGTHPVFGPCAENIENQNFILTPVGNREKRFAENFKGWLEKKRANVLIMSPRKHDQLMSIVLGFPHFLGLVVCDALLSHPNFRETKKVAGTSYKMLLTLAQAVASEETKFYASLQMHLPEAEKIESLFLEKSKEWLDVVRRKDKVAFIKKMELVKKKLREEDPEYKRSYEVMH